MSRKIIRKKVNKYLQRPVAQLDLHGCTRAEAKTELIDFLNYWQEQGGGVKLLIITGQGWHSTNQQGVLKEFTASWLKEQGYHFQIAKPQDGGSGAVIINLPIN